MTTLTNRLNEKLFTELASTEAEVIQGGWAFKGYDYYDLKGKRLAAAKSRIPKLKYDNDISSVRITSGRWALYAKPNYKGLLVVLGKGDWNLISANNKVSSIKRID